MSIQTVIADVLDAALNLEPDEPKGYVVRGYWWHPDAAEPGKTYVSVYRTIVAPAEAAAGARRHDVEIVVMSSKADPATADDDLGAALDDVLDVIDSDDQLYGLVWQQAQRGVIAETFPAYTITGWVGTNTEQE